MGSEISAFAVDDDELLAVVGQRDREALGRVLAAGADSIASRDRSFAKPGQLTPITDALTELCDGTVIDAVTEGFRSGYALEIACRVFYC